MPESASDRLLGELARERGGALTGYAYLLTGEAAAAEDLVQDALVKVFVRTRSGFTPEVAEAYVRRAILTLYVDGFRRRQRWAAVRHLLVRDDRRDGPDAAVAVRLDLRAALGVLAPQERACVVLRYYEDLTVPEIAAQLQLAPGTVKRYLSNAVHKLEARLGPTPSLHLPDAVGDVIVVGRTATTSTATSSNRTNPTTRRGADHV
ncbi:sigma-70 family RNA polymerase sigma factor [Pengzhenrongella frigida]|uniref:Sigma-70 family RNA polymerase sigma factor n=1 Tax=Pengzhenrongella frigida TaxID=1259133 RepID=A0A4Q5N079_9MICO|nr:sigma-70 family RNA polymerase sigma factor [Cellulomonas sp. HLT2-17]RYV51429.1 sigma-70 family RNA polymerase sigma factor [Cellulomonas sp. HLT2-17]